MRLSLVLLLAITVAAVGVTGCGQKSEPVPFTPAKPSAESAKQPQPHVSDAYKAAADRDRAVALIKRLDGKTEQDPNAPEHPVVTVDLEGKPLSDDGLAQLSVLNEVRSLKLDGTKITDDAVGRLKEFKKLEVLTLPGAAAMDKGMAQLAGLTSLKELGIGPFSPATDAGFGQLKALTRLKKLNVSYSGFGDASLEQLKDTLNLEGLVLNSTKTTDAGLVHLRGMKSLRYLSLGECKVTQAGKKTLQQALPQCDIPFPTDR